MMAAETNPAKLIALQRPPSWSEAAALPPAGAWCSCCRGQRWWSEAREPTGWRCYTCHPPAHLPAEAVREMRTDIAA
jgi:hypothetical protein